MSKFRQVPTERRIGQDAIDPVSKPYGVLVGGRKNENAPSAHMHAVYSHNQWVVSSKTHQEAKLHAIAALRHHEASVQRTPELSNRAYSASKKAMEAGGRPLSLLHYGYHDRPHSQDL